MILKLDIQWFKAKCRWSLANIISASSGDYGTDPTVDPVRTIGNTETQMGESTISKLDCSVRNL